MLLVDYEYYSDTYEGSSIPETSFKTIAIEASSIINYYTFNRIDDEVINDNIRNTACEIAELIYSQKELKDALITSDDTIKASETVGPHSISYVNKTTLQEKYILSSDELDQECYRICLRNLGLTGLMYRGF